MGISKPDGFFHCDFVEWIDYIFHGICFDTASVTADLYLDLRVFYTLDDGDNFK